MQAVRNLPPLALEERHEEVPYAERDVRPRVLQFPGMDQHLPLLQPHRGVEDAEVRAPAPEVPRVGQEDVDREGLVRRVHVERRPPLRAVVLDEVGLVRALVPQRAREQRLRVEGVDLVEELLESPLCRGKKAWDGFARHSYPFRIRVVRVTFAHQLQLVALGRREQPPWQQTKKRGITSASESDFGTAERRRTRP